MKIANKLIAGIIATAIALSCLFTVSYATGSAEADAFSQSFISSVNSYNSDSSDYAYLTDCVSAFGYLLDNANESYDGMAEAIAEYNALVAKVDAIEDNAEKFISAVADMTVNKVSSVSASAPYLTTNFADLYAKYTLAMSVYTNGTVYEGLDASTYPGLSAAVETFAGSNGFKAYVEGRLLDCENFVNAVNKAASSSSYVSILNELDKAALYLDTNLDKSLENHGGVAEAIVLYAALREQLAGSVADAGAYINAVNAIDINAAYSALKAAVNAARALKEAGDVVGVDGVQEANVKFSAAEAKVVSLEGNSKTLKDAVAALKTAKTVAERRELIFIANNAKDKAEDTISGVTEAKAELVTLVEAFNQDVAAANAAFFATVNGAASVAAYTVPSANAYKTADVVKAFLK